ncbi:hypothetical protein Clacol_004355 [Clathrus columnatus]|uniref:Uncharacterized protein n=1 Tax=Clathrus columnatus TaxID=1419009 RepID=A0AAV5AA73_9AGAM|nr:hypothetical protein Clacol_004355 [Clathrus columnatus]
MRFFSVNALLLTVIASAVVATPSPSASSASLNIAKRQDDITIVPHNISEALKMIDNTMESFAFHMRFLLTVLKGLNEEQNNSTATTGNGPAASGNGTNAIIAISPSIFKLISLESSSIFHIMNLLYLVIALEEVVWDETREVYSLKFYTYECVKYF